MQGKWIVFAAVLVTVLGLDLASKSWALQTLDPGHPPRYLGGWLPLTLHFNTGGLWGVGSGRFSRWFFLVATVVALVVLVRLFRQTETRAGSGQRLRLLLIPAIAAGALGNLVDRLRWERGVVDFIGPVDLGFMLWPIFNVADVAISCGTALLLVSLWRHPVTEPEEESARRETGSSTAA